MSDRILMQGNDAIARGLVAAGCAVAASYPGTPASEILSSIDRWRKKCGATMHVEWAVNEKVALEIAYTAAIAGLRAAVSMKQVGLNVASDPLLSAAYLGVTGGFLVVSADDPGPHSSQTEQDSRLLAMMAKVPVLDPASPSQAMALAGTGFDLSEAFGVPVMLRPTTRVCHASQDVDAPPFRPPAREARFVKDPARWAATPVYRRLLHDRLAEKIAAIAAWPATAPVRVNPEVSTAKAVVASGVAFAHARELFGELGISDRIALYQVIQPYPLHAAFIDHLLETYAEILVLEESAPVIEMQIADRRRVRGRMTGAVPGTGELLPEIIGRLLSRFAGLPVPDGALPAQGGGRRPTLCPGCAHRSSFYAIRKAAPGGIYPSDIGCYTLGINLGAVDTVLCMGAAVSQAAGFDYAHRLSGKPVDIVATIGDSTFYHSGIPPLIDAVVQGARFVLVILDNGTTAMTGNQPTPGTGIGAGGETTAAVDMEGLVRACGVRFCRTANPDRLPEFVALLKEALVHARERGVAVVIARQPCAMVARRRRREGAGRDRDHRGVQRVPALRGPVRMPGPGLRRGVEPGPDRRDDLHRLRRVRFRLPGGRDPAGVGRGDAFMSADVGKSTLMRQQIVLSGVGGQGILFLSRLLAEAAIAGGFPVLTSETHGMAQRGGVVVSHLKVGGFDSPLVRAGRADLLLVLKEENVVLHREFLAGGGALIVNAPVPADAGPGVRVHAVDADALALSAGAPHAVNLVLLGFALARIGGGTAGGFFCAAGEIREALSRRHGGGGSRLADALSALDLGIAHGT